ncbi:alpha/beta hydrolase [Cohnella sp. REN36]|uniref:alpha/beta hydrolase family protein n=1 Tax=Cohnella sp. REN36 TaxID=2887347 RepID=UPI002714C275|nr:alpha/beta hydrolase [Cohnella sp. REN36]
METAYATTNPPIGSGRPGRPSGLARLFAGTGRHSIAVLAGCLIACGLSAAVVAAGAPTGLGRAFDAWSAAAISAVGLALSAVFVTWLLSLFRRPLPGTAIGGTLYTAVLVYFLLYLNGLGVVASLVFSAGYTMLASALGFCVGIAIDRRRGWRARGAALAALGLLVSFAVYAGTAARGEEPLPTLNAADLPADLPAVPDPSVPGNYAFDIFAYGSGADKHRTVFGKGAALRSDPVDASAYIPAWPLLRRWFWGFDAHRLPLNGRVWMPQGDGPFPLALIVHGNHAMEDFSDAGYAYLGEQLASRGYIVVSVDENFLNYSTWSGIPEQDMKARAWLLLRHIGQLQAFAAEPGAPFYGKIDFDRVALIGHSRGGQAVAMAADRARWFADDPDLPAAGTYRVRAVAALAPTDTEVDGAQAEISDISYLTLQGASDADVNNFYGERQFSRVSFTGAATGALKASLYIADANHGQFNSDWGATDSAWPAGLFLRKPSLSGSDQEKIAKAYVTAFLETVVRGDDAYRDLLRDYRAGRGFLPDTRYFNRYEDAGFSPIVRFDEAASAGRPAPEVVAEGAGFQRWELTEALDRQRYGKGTKGTALEWSEDGGTYAIEADKGAAFEMPDLASADQAALVFSMADLSRELEEPAESAAAPLDVRIRLEDADGVEVTLPLDAFMSPEPLPETSFTWSAWLAEQMEDGKYEESVEPVFQTYALPLQAFLEEDASFSPDAIRKISFLFAGGPGAAMLGDIGIAASAG